MSGYGSAGAAPAEWEEVTLGAALSGATLDVTGFEAGYDYRVELRGARGGSGDFSCRVGTGVTPRWNNSNYKSACTSKAQTTAFADDGSGVTTEMLVSGAPLWNSTSPRACYLTIDIFDPGAATPTMVRAFGVGDTGSAAVGLSCGLWLTTTPVTGLQLRPWSSFAAGTYSVYRRANV